MKIEMNPVTNKQKKTQRSSHRVRYDILKALNTSLPRTKLTSIVGINTKILTRNIEPLITAGYVEIINAPLRYRGRRDKRTDFHYSRTNKGNRLVMNRELEEFMNA